MVSYFTTCILTEFLTRKYLMYILEKTRNVMSEWNLRLLQKKNKR